MTGANLSHRYLWQPGAVDQLMADEQVSLNAEPETANPPAVLWALTDHLGTVRDLAQFDAATGTTAIVDHIVYNAFGKVVSETDPSQGSLIGFTGRATDNLTGIESHDQRVKIAGGADWMSQDPIGFGAGDANARRYCFNSPTNGTDPTGLDFGLWIGHSGYNFEPPPQKPAAPPPKRVFSAPTISADTRTPREIFESDARWVDEKIRRNEGDSKDLDDLRWDFGKLSDKEQEQAENILGSIYDLYELLHSKHEEEETRNIEERFRRARPGEEWIRPEEIEPKIP